MALAGSQKTDRHSVPQPDQRLHRHDIPQWGQNYPEQSDQRHRQRLGSATAALVIADGATLDLNIRQLYAKPITVQGAGVGGNGAIVNNDSTAPSPTQYDISNLTLSGNTTFGGTSLPGTTNPGLPGSQYVGRWSLRGSNGTSSLSTGGNAYTLTKVGNNQIMLVNAIADPALADVFVNEGVLSIEGTTTLGNSANTVTVDGSKLAARRRLDLAVPQPVRPARQANLA